MNVTLWTSRLGLALAVVLGLFGSPSYAQTLRIGLAEDPDVLDPTLARTFVGRIVFSALCDKLVDIDEKLNIVPQLATSWEWSADHKALTMKLRPGVTFQDGEKLDAEAVKFSLLPAPRRAGEGAGARDRRARVHDSGACRLRRSPGAAPRTGRGPSTARGQATARRWG